MWRIWFWKTAAGTPNAPRDREPPAVKPIEWRDIALFAVAAAVLLLAAVMWSADRYQFALHTADSGSRVHYAWRMDKRTGELCSYDTGVGLNCSQPGEK